MYIVATSKDDLKNEGKDLFTILASYENEPLGYIVKGQEDGITKIQTNLDDNTKAHGAFYSRLSQVEYRVSSDYYKINSCNAIEILDGRTVLGRFLNSHHPFVTFLGMLKGTYIRFDEQSPILDFSKFSLEVISKEDVFDVNASNVISLLNSSSFGYIDDIPDFDQYQAFLQGYNGIGKEFFNTYSYQELAETGIGEKFPEFYSRILSIAQEMIDYGKEDKIIYWLDRLPEPHRSYLLNKIE